MSVTVVSRWELQRNGTRQRMASNISMQHWGYNLPVAAGASVGVLVTAVSAWIEVRAAWSCEGDAGVRE